MAVSYPVSKVAKLGDVDVIHRKIAVLWDQGFALGTIERRTGVPAARCCKIAKDFWRQFGGNERPLEEDLPK